MANFTSSYSTDPTDLNDFLNSTIWVEELCKELGAKSVTDVARDILVAAASEATNPGSISSTRFIVHFANRYNANVPSKFGSTGCSRS